MSDLILRIFNVGFGDAILLTIPDSQTGTRTLMIDGGNAFAGAGGDDNVLLSVMRSIEGLLNGAPLDVYLSTHEHLDHIQGPLLAERRAGFALKARQVWMTASSHPDYYDTHPEARKRRRLALDAFDDLARSAAALKGARPLWMETVLNINNPRASADCVDYIRAMALDGAPQYLARDASPDHPFEKTTLQFLAPEQDSSVYYGRLKPRTIALGEAAALEGTAGAEQPTAPPGVDPDHFRDLLRTRAQASNDNLLHIDKAANNSSVVFELDWQGWRLLFAGDAEEKSWALMERQGLLRPVHFLKVSHHGSANGSPDDALDLVLPREKADPRVRFAAISTRNGSYSDVPNAQTLDTLSARCDVFSTEDIPPAHWLEFRFEKTGGATCAVAAEKPQ